ncbi:hypothetical protein AruPA_13660 [Acidiphilium sp. PA]|uniref:hypothetical protein n=1 Tax=Acidiphilium sp. PA TaxID=2871705 RepID=UPI002244094A|nr:hypothetical protein [Acidiphilium sp. PA]MCW8308087.1 hypothetical protein [Acidiphilium sp. PA]
MSFYTVSAVLAVHLLAFAGWTGFLAGYLLIGAAALRLLRWCLVIMPVSLVSGWGLAWVQYGGPAAWPWAINAMQTAGLAMAIVLLIAWFGGVLLVRDAESAGDPPAIAGAARRLRRLAAVDLLLGVLILGFAVLGRFG